MKVRLMGTVDECAAAVTALRAIPGLTVVEVSAPYPNRGASTKVRVYVQARITPGTPPASGGPS